MPNKNANRLNVGPNQLNINDATKDELVALVRNMAYGAGVDVAEKNLRKQKKQDLLSVVNGMASFVSRSSLQSALGQSFNGLRDLYNVLGWKKQLAFPDYLNMYERNGIAARIVDIKADEAWRKFPYLHDGKTVDDYKDSTPFLMEWGNLVETQNLASIFNELDIALGISRFSVIVVGIKGDKDYSKPIEKNTGKQNNIALLRVLDEGQVTMSEPISDIYNSRYGLPMIYRCQFEEEGPFIPVHWTRIVHFKQGRGRSNTYGVPGLQKSYNYLQDLEKVVGSSSEAFWQHIRRVTVMSAKEGFSLPSEGTPEYANLQTQVEEFEHQMRLVLRLRNMEVSQLGSQAVDGMNQHDLLIADISGTEGIPQRILVGSERGELASSQDVRSLYSMIEARQKKTCEPWLRQFVKYCYEWGFIPAPSSGKFQVEWQSLYQPNPLERIDIAKGEADVINIITGDNFEQVMTVDDFMERHFDGYKKGKVKQINVPIEGIGIEEEEEEEEEEEIGAAGLQDSNVTAKVMI